MNRRLASQPRRKETRSYRVAILVGVLLAALLWLADRQLNTEDNTAPQSAATTTRQSAILERQANPRSLAAERLALWWDKIPDAVRAGSVQTGTTSNIHPEDYIGPESCRKCHQENYELWSQHAHRWMNALANENTVKGDFSGDSSISYLGGLATFYRKGQQYRMRLQRGDLVRVYAITQTIGSRFYQYYVGKQLIGPEPRDSDFYILDHVLPFGYWLEQQEWVPVVHVSSRMRNSEMPDGRRIDPFGEPDTSFYTQCNSCHTTFALGDRFMRDLAVIERHSPRTLHWDQAGYLAKSRPDLLDPQRHPSDVDDVELEKIVNEIYDFEAPTHAITLGISCEACHLGAQQHAEGVLERPEFFPKSPFLLAERSSTELEFGKTHENLNWACARCHAGDRPQFAAGMATWNSTEYTDAMRGSCYSQLTCVNCHNPHQGIGPQWTLTAEQDDHSCLKCHSEYEPAAARQSHTHHPLGSDGARCMNCHMPRLNEGMQDVVRTHMIYSPTRADMIEANQPNACNLCHSGESIDWTLGHLADWYGAKYDPRKIALSYGDRQRSAAVGWLDSDNESVRLVAAAALAGSGDRRFLPHLLDQLDDAYLLNRQFARKGIEEMLELRLEDFGYRFYMTPEERRQPLERLRAELLAD